MHGFQSCEYRYINLFFRQVIVNLICFVVDNMYLIQNFVLVEEYVKINIIVIVLIFI